MFADVLVTAQAASTLFLAGLSWTVAVVVYPSFALVPGQGWAEFHDAHSRRITGVVTPAWAVQGATVAGLLVSRPPGVPLWLVLLAGVGGVATIGTTFVGAVPLHNRLGRGSDLVLLRRLERWHWWRTAAWTGCAAVGLAMLLLARR